MGRGATADMEKSKEAKDEEKKKEREKKEKKKSEDKRGNGGERLRGSSLVERPR